jgi:aspartyl-tRNA(Asn)/glutamyl-tRNA(Gln) amidotransferase subunit B
VDILVGTYGLTAKDAITLLSLDNSERLDYFHEAVNILGKKADKFEPGTKRETLGKMAGDW